MNEGRKLSTEHFNSFLLQECAGIERFYNGAAIRKDVAPPMLRAIFLTKVLGDAPFTQQTFISSVDNQPGEVAEAAEHAAADHPDKTLAGAFFLTSLGVENKETGEVRKMLMISGRTTDGRTNAGIYFYETDEDGRYYVVQDTVRPFDPGSLANIEINVPAVDAYFKAYTRAKLMTGGDNVQLKQKG